MNCPRTIVVVLVVSVLAKCQDDHNRNSGHHNHRHHHHPHHKQHLHRNGHQNLGQPEVAIVQGCAPLLQPPPPLKRHYLTNRTVTCNDGTPAGYYIRKSHGSKRWIVFLEGGWYCFDARSCKQRWVRMRAFMTSRHWMESRHVGGIMSADPQENPYWWNANHVFVPYCSSDTWSGAAFANDANDFAFLGSLIIEEVFHDLIAQGILGARRLLLAGSSAGGTGVMLNVDRVAELLRSWGSRAQVRALADSGWFLDNEPYAPTDCTEWHSCAPLQAVKLAHRLWNGQVPTSCKLRQPITEQWRCYFGYVMYADIATPLFVFQWLFDEAQLTADNLGAPLTKAQWDYIHAFGDDLRRSLRNVTAVFAPSCISHTVLTKRDWRLVRVNDISLTEALHCWETSTADRQRAMANLSLPTNTSVAMLSDSPNSSVSTVSSFNGPQEVRRPTPSSGANGNRRRKNKKKPQSRKRNRKGNSG